MDDRQKIWNALLLAEKKARSTPLGRFLKAPIIYPLLMVFNKVYYPIAKRGIYLDSEMFFGRKMKTLLPAGTDIKLNGIKSHDSEIRLTKFLTRYNMDGVDFIDVGAHYGYYALLASYLLDNRGKVYAIEASKHSYEILLENTTQYANIKIYHNAAGNIPGEVTFYEYPGPLAEYNTTVKDAYAQSSWIKNVPQTINIVETIILDDLIAQHQISKAIIKIDVEGGELSVIKGLSKSLENVELTIVMEYLWSPDLSSPHHQAAEMLIRRGYKAHSIDRGGELSYVDDIDAYLKKEGLDSDNLVFEKPKRTSVN